MLTVVVVLVVLVSLVLPNETSFDCPMRQMAMEFAAYIQPNLSTEELQEIADALNGSKKQSNCTITPKNLSSKYLKARPKHRTPKTWQNDKFPPFYDPKIYSDIIYIYCDTINGDDSNIGNELYPFKTLYTAVSKSRSYGINVLKHIILRKGKYYLDKTLKFTFNDSNLIIRNYNNEKVSITGANILNCKWKLYKNMSRGYGIYTCFNNSIDKIPGLRVNSLRGIRARYPNANPETDGFGSTLHAKAWIPPNGPFLPDFDYVPMDYPIRNDSADEEFWYYSLGIGGTCNGQFTPNAGYWCSSNVAGGGAQTYHIIQGIVFNDTILPNSPYKDPTQAIVHVWRPGHWATWMFNISEYTNTSFNFAVCGFQGARGYSSGDEFYVENIFEELDYPSEYFWNETTNTLYWYNNETGIPNQTFEYTNTKELMSFIGSMEKPVMNISIQGLTFRDTAYTYMDTHGIPSGGDWGLQRTGAIYLDGVENVIISNNLFTRLDGNAISLNRYARNVTITENEFAWTGDSGITLWGDTEGIRFPSENTVTEMGYDGTTGNQPRGIVITKNHMHEFGIWEKQSSFHFQAKSCLNKIEYNIIYNCPKVGITYNDGFGGGSLIYKNLLFNIEREGNQQAPFNSWDRQPYVTKVRDGTPSVFKAYDIITNNFMINNYGARESIDNDDGYLGLKADFGGHNNYHTNNIYAYVTYGFDMDAQGGIDQLPGHNNIFSNNTVVLLGGNIDYGKFNCNVTRKDGWPILGNNIVRTSNNWINQTGLCNMNEENFQKTYNYDLGTIVLGYNDTQILNEAYNLLFTN